MTWHLERGIGIFLMVALLLCAMQHNINCVLVSWGVGGVIQHTKIW